MNRNEFEDLEIGSIVERPGHWKGIVLDIDESDDTLEVEITEHEYDDDAIGFSEWKDFYEVELIGSGANKTSTVISILTPKFNSTITRSEVDTAVILGIIK